MGPLESRPDETRALSRLAFEELRGAAGGVREIHRAIADRAFGAAGAGALPARAVHDAVANGVYGAVRGVTGLLGHAADAGLRRRPPADARWLSTSPGGAIALGALDGLIGDALERRGGGPPGGKKETGGGRGARAGTRRGATTAGSVVSGTWSRWARLTWGRRWRRPCTGRAPGSTWLPKPVPSRPSFAGAAPASATCARARSSTRIGANSSRTPCAPRPAERCPCWRAPPIASSRPRSHAARGIRSGAYWATASCSSRAPQGAAARAASRSGPSTACTSAGPIT